MFQAKSRQRGSSPSAFRIAVNMPSRATSTLKKPSVVEIVFVPRHYRSVPHPPRFDGSDSSEWLGREARTRPRGSTSAEEAPEADGDSSTTCTEPGIFRLKPISPRRCLARLGARSVRDGRAQSIHLLERQIEDLAHLAERALPR